MTDYGKLIREEEHRIEMLAVDHPPHYNQHGIECIDAIQAALGDGFKNYLQGNILKYMWRYEYKNKKEDLLKAQWYLNKLIEVYK
ncbi:MAG: DUF3310 domain-containing protein [Pelagibacteraceae bacterium]